MERRAERNAGIRARLLRSRRAHAARFCPLGPLRNPLANVTNLSEGRGSSAYVSGVNGMSKPGYMGPRPPKGHGIHHYYFWIYALDQPLNLKPGMNREELLDQISPHILEQARIVGLYEN
jgi:Raf kinase inhibitor-like YbhB/YbcL family protein